MNRCFHRFTDMAVPGVKQYIEEGNLDDEEELKHIDDLSDCSDEESNEDEISGVKCNEGEAEARLIFIVPIVAYGLFIKMLILQHRQG